MARHRDARTLRMEDICFFLLCPFMLHAFVSVPPEESRQVPHMYGAVGSMPTWKRPAALMNSLFRYKISAPDLYASSDNCTDKDAINAFNCIQRGHQNSLEYQPAFLALLATAGLKV